MVCTAEGCGGPLAIQVRTRSLMLMTRFPVYTTPSHPPPPPLHPPGLPPALAPHPLHTPLKHPNQSPYPTSPSRATSNPASKPNCRIASKMKSPPSTLPRRQRRQMPKWPLDYKESLTPHTAQPQQAGRAEREQRRVRMGSRRRKRKRPW